MFHLIITLAYTIPGAYIFLRIWQFYSEKKYRWRYIAVLAILYAVYPVSGLFDERKGVFINLLQSVSEYLLPVFLYLFLSLLITDLLLLINRFVKIIPREKTSDNKFRNWLFITIITISVSVVIAGIINFNTIRITEYRAEVPKRTSGIENLRIAFVSDFHLEEKSQEGFVKRYIMKINELKPDLLLYGGDIIEGYRETEKMEHIENLLKGIKTQYGIYGAPGNHDRINFSDTVNFFTRSGITILNDSVVVIPGAFSIAGRAYNREDRRKSASAIVNSCSDSLPVIVIDHRPTDLEQLSLTRADLVFSGHTHHGQMFPINLITSRVYELSYGYKKKRNTHFFVSSGIHLWGPPVRTIAKSEIVVVDVKFPPNH